MKPDLPSIAEFLTEVERLKLVDRRAYVSDLTRRENSAEHSWHLAVGLLCIASELQIKFDVLKALKIALIHDLGEIDAGDTPIYGAHRVDQSEAELKCVERLAELGGSFGNELKSLWVEYEEQTSVESRWVKVLDRLMPFIVNLATQGRTWQEQSVTRSQLLRVNEPIRVYAPEIFSWIEQRVEQCVRNGWLHDA